MEHEWNADGTPIPKMEREWNADPIYYNISGNKKAPIRIILINVT
jgi:hypothetical protein